MKEQPHVLAQYKGTRIVVYKSDPTINFVQQRFFFWWVTQLSFINPFHCNEAQADERKIVFL